MKNFKKAIVLIMALALVFAFTGCSTNVKYTSADFPYYNDGDGLVADSDIIVVGKVLKVEGGKDINISTEADNEFKVRYTVSDVEVTEVVKGDIQVGEVIQVKQLGDEKVINEELKKNGYFKKGTENVFFLKSFEAIAPGMPYSTLTPYQGHVELENGKAKVNEENKLFANGMDKKELVEGLKAKVK